MSAVRTSVVALLLLAGCGNPYAGDTGGGGTSNKSVSELPGTTSPTPGGAVKRTENVNKGPGGAAVTGNGYAEGFTYDAGADTFTVDGLAFDGGNVYQRDDVVPTVGPAQVYKADSTYADNLTGALIDQFSYRALYGVSTTGRTQYAIVRTGAYANYGFGGFIFSRTQGPGALPTSGQAQYQGTYAGLRDTNGAGGLQYTTGDMQMDIDFADFNPSKSKTGNGAGIQGYVSNRQIFDLDGNNVTQNVIDAINADHTTQDTPLTDLPTLTFDVGPGVLDNNGEAQGQLSSKLVISGKATVLESGKYYAVLSGTDEVAGVIVVNSQVNSITTRETGGFILYRPVP